MTPHEIIGKIDNLQQVAFREDLSKITETQKAMKIAAFGVFGMGDNGQTWKRNNCGSKF